MMQIQEKSTNKWTAFVLFGLTKEKIKHLVKEIFSAKQNCTSLPDLRTFDGKDRSAVQTLKLRTQAATPANARTKT